MTDRHPADWNTGSPFVLLYETNFCNLSLWPWDYEGYNYDDSLVLILDYHWGSDNMFVAHKILSFQYDSMAYCSITYNSIASHTTAWYMGYDNITYDITYDSMIYRVWQHHIWHHIWQHDIWGMTTSHMTSHMTAWYMGYDNITYDITYDSMIYGLWQHHLWHHYFRQHHIW